MKTLLSTGRDVVTTDVDFAPGRLQRLLTRRQLDGLPLVVLDVTRLEDVRRVVAGYDVTHIAHLAGLMAPACRADPARGVAVNVLGAGNVFVSRHLRGSGVGARGPGRLRQLGCRLRDSAVVRKDGHRGSGGASTAPSDVVRHHQEDQEDLARAFADTTGLASTGLRYSVVHGPGRDVGMTSDITEALQAPAAGRAFAIGFTGSTELHYVADVARAFSWCLNAEDDQVARTYNLHGHSVTVPELISLMDAALPPSSPVWSPAPVRL